MTEPVKPHPSHEWYTPEGMAATYFRCRRCGAYKHLGSGIFPCEPPPVKVAVEPGDTLAAALKSAEDVVNQLKTEIERRQHARADQAT
jgi:hypothetical protein